MRNNVEKPDLTFISWLCSNGYGGFIGMDLEDMHDEISICFSRKGYNIEEVLDYIGTIEPAKYMNFTISDEPYISYPELNIIYPIPSLDRDKREQEESLDEKDENLL